MIIQIKDTRFEEYTSNVKKRISTLVKILDGHGPRFDRDFQENKLKESIIYDEFMKTRIPKIVGIENLASSVQKTNSLSTYAFSGNYHRDQFIIFSDNHGEKFDLEWIPMSGPVYQPVYPRIGIEGGFIDSIEQYLWTFHRFDQIIESEEVVHEINLQNALRLECK